jgi:tetratricopeptide (TPR) repeat protein
MFRKMSTSRTLAVCLITRDNAATLDDCLSSLEGLADAIHVTDTGSTDATLEIARRHGAQLRLFLWQDDFAAARNASIAGVQSDWILILDSDDRFPPGEFRKLRAGLDHAGDGAAASLRYSVRPDHSPLRVSRILRNRDGLRFDGRIHETPARWLHQQLRAGGRIQELDVDLIHEGYTDEAMPGKIRRNLPLLQAEWKVSSRMPGTNRYHVIAADLAMTLAQDGRTDDAATFLNPLVSAALDHCPPGQGGKSLLSLWVKQLWIARNHQNPKAALEVARRAEPALGHLGVYALHRGLAEIAASQLPAARPWLERFHATASAPEIPVPLEFLGAGLDRLLGSCCLASGDPQAALDHFQRALVTAPNDRDLQLRARTARAQLATAS